VKFNSVKVVLLTFYYDFWHWLIQINYNMKTKFNGILTLLLAFVVQLTFAQEKTISGTVVDETNMPLPGATVVIKGTTTGTSTDFDGNYSISANSGDVLTFSYVGYADQNATVGASNSINISLAPDNTLEEVVVTALGIKRKSDEITTANQVVKSEQLTQANNPDVVVGLSGKVSGLQINTTANGVSADTRIVLRGNRSISGNNEALVVIDGVISTANFLKALDPNSVESVNVIKGANGAALYGSAGSNGAIIVTTKKGSGGTDKFTVAVKSSIDFEEIAFLPQRQTRYGQGWSDTDQGYTNFTYENGGWGPEFDGHPAIIGLPQADGSYVTRPYSSLGDDNIKDFFKTGVTTQNQVALSVGNAESYVNLTAQTQETQFVIDGDQLKKTAFNFKAGKTLGKWSLGGNATYINQKTQEASNTTLYNDLLQTASNIDVTDFEHSGNEGHWNGYFFNPYWLRDNNRSENQTTRFNLVGDIGYKINDNINIAIRPSATIYSNNFLSHAAAYSDPDSVEAITGNVRSQQSSFRRTKNTSRKFYTDAFLNLDYMLTDDINFKSTLGVNNTTTYTDYISIGGNNLTIPGLYASSNLSDGLNDGVTFDVNSLSRRYAAFGSVDFGYKDFLFVNATGRNDWTSVLAKENNSFFYPSAGISFIPTKAFDNIRGDVLSKVKLMASWVKVGNDGDITPYRINQTVAQGQGFPFNSNSYVLNNSSVDPFLKPEFTTSMEFGANIELLKSRVTIDASFYNATTTDLITQLQPAQSTGLGGATGGTLNTATINVGELDSKGFEIDLGVRAIDTDNFSWDVNLSYATSEATIVDINDSTDEIFLGGYTGGAGIYAIKGEEFPLIKGTAYLRDDLGRVIVDANGVPQEDPNLQVLGKSTPDYVLGLNTQLRYKNLTLSGTVDYRTGHQFYSRTKYAMTWSGHLVESADNRGGFLFPNSSYDSGGGVYVENTNITSANSPSALTQFYSNSVANIDENNVLDATAFKLRELALRYDFSPKMLDKTPLTALSLSVVGRNLLTVLPKENRGYADPESNFSNGNAQGLSTTGQYPPTRTYGFSVNLTF
jgi:TonB-linked SusC/RagA family outer membrane protein